MGNHEILEERRAWMEQVHVADGEELHLPPLEADEMIATYTLVDAGYDASEYVMAFELEKSYDIPPAIVERILWECEGRFNTPGLNLTCPFRNVNHFAPSKTLNEIVRRHINAGGLAYYKDKVRDKILLEAQGITGKKYNAANTIAAYCDCARDTCVVKAKYAVILLHKNGFKHIRDCRILTKSFDEIVIDEYTNSLQPNTNHKYDRKADEDKWQALLPQLKGKGEKATALVVIEKWQGKTHVEAYDARFPKKKELTSRASKKNYVFKAREKAMKIIRDYPEQGLIMPPWDTTE
jgi:hypothetical protein